MNAQQVNKTRPENYPFPNLDELVITERCTGWCWPLYIHLIVSLLQVVVIMNAQVALQLHPFKSRPASFRKRLQSAAVVSIWNAVLAAGMYYLCTYCNTGWSWVILLFSILFNVYFFWVFAYYLGNYHMWQ